MLIPYISGWAPRKPWKVGRLDVILRAVYERRTTVVFALVGKRQHDPKGACVHGRDAWVRATSMKSRSPKLAVSRRGAYLGSSVTTKN